MDLPPEADRPTAYLIGLGDGPVDDLTLRAWGLLASGDPVLLADPHPLKDELAARGLTFDLLDGADDDDVATWAGGHKRSVIAVAGSLLSNPRVPGIIRAARARDLDLIAVPSTPAWLPEDEDLYNSALTAGRAEEAGAAFTRLVGLMHRLRRPGGCPWDREQTHESLALHLLEEAYEALDAIDRNDAADLAEELGDVLLQVVFHSEIASEGDRFDAAQVAQRLSDKLVDRHPHVFGDVSASTAEEVVRRWEAHKQQASPRASLDEGIPKNTPALAYAYKVQRRMASAPGEEIADSEAKRIGSILSAEALDDADIGELLMAVVALSLRSGVDPEGALRRAVRRLVEAHAAESDPR